MSNYNGWKNHATWNVALWIGNDEGLYNLAKSMPSYTAFADCLHDMHQGESEIYLQTPDKVAWNDSGLDIVALDEMIAELKGEESDA